MNNVNVRISTLWIVVMFNMLFADMLTMHIPEFIQEVVAGTTSIEITQELMLAMAFFVEIPIAMIFLSRVLKGAACRWANTLAAVITAVFIVAGAEFALHYYFFALVQLLCLLLVLRYAWYRPKDRYTGKRIEVEQGLTGIQYKSEIP